MDERREVFNKYYGDNYDEEQRLKSKNGNIVDNSLQEGSSNIK